MPCLPAGEAGQGRPAGGGAAPAAGQPEAAGGVADGRRPAAHLHRVVLQHRGQEGLGTPRRLQPRAWSQPSLRRREAPAARSVWHRAPAGGAARARDPGVKMNVLPCRDECNPGVRVDFSFRRY